MGSQALATSSSISRLDLNTLTNTSAADWKLPTPPKLSASHHHLELKDGNNTYTIGIPKYDHGNFTLTVRSALKRSRVRGADEEAVRLSPGDRTALNELASDIRNALRNQSHAQSNLLGELGISPDAVINDSSIVSISTSRLIGDKDREGRGFRLHIKRDVPGVGEIRFAIGIEKFKGIDSTKVTVSSASDKFVMHSSEQASANLQFAFKAARQCFETRHGKIRNL